MAPVVRPLAVVVWDDAHGSATTDVTPEDLDHKPLVMTTVGWLLREDDLGVSIANEKCQVDGKDVYRGHTFVPRALIRSCTLFTLAKVRKKKVENLEMPPQPRTLAKSASGGRR